MITDVLAPLFHEYTVPPDELSVALCPAQMVVFALTAAVIVPELVTVIVLVRLHPLASVVVTE